MNNIDEWLKASFFFRTNVFGVIFINDKCPILSCCDGFCEKWALCVSVPFSTLVFGFRSLRYPFLVCFGDFAFSSQAELACRLLL